MRSTAQLCFAPWSSCAHTPHKTPLHLQLATCLPQHYSCPSLHQSYESQLDSTLFPFMPPKHQPKDDLGTYVVQRRISTNLAPHSVSEG